MGVPVSEGAGARGGSGSAWDAGCGGCWEKGEGTRGASLSETACGSDDAGTDGALSPWLAADEARGAAARAPSAPSRPEA